MYDILCKFVIAETLPWNEECLLSETYSCLGRLPNHQILYVKLFYTVNDADHSMKILQKCNTRWMTILETVNYILFQWLELHNTFKIERLDEKCCTPESYFKINNDVSKFTLFFWNLIWKNVTKYKNHFNLVLQTCY